MGPIGVWQIITAAQPALERGSSEMEIQSSEPPSGNYPGNSLDSFFVESGSCAFYFGLG